MRSTSRSRSTRKVGATASQPSDAGVTLEAEAAQNALDLARRRPPRRAAAPAVAAQVQPLRPRGRRIAIDDRADSAAGADLLHQRDRALERDDARVDVGAALEARRRFGLEAEPLARAPHRRRLEVGALEARSSSSTPRPRTPRRPSRRRSPARDRASAMTSMSGSSVRSTPSSVVMRLARLRAARRAARAPASCARSNACIGWPSSMHHVVGDVDDRADRTDAGRLEPRGQPGRRRPDR